MSSRKLANVLINDLYRLMTGLLSQKMWGWLSPWIDPPDSRGLTSSPVRWTCCRYNNVPLDLEAELLGQGSTFGGP